MISAPEAEPAHHERPLRYLIARHENNRLEVLTLATSSHKVALPVFGTERAARDFLLGGGFSGGWRVRESTTGELVSLLLGRPAVVDSVALDPRPGITTPDDAELRGKKGFIEVLMGKPFEAPYSALRPFPSPSAGGPKR
jgi:hypothetical protein